MYEVYGFKFEFESLPPKSLEYLLKYGASQSLQDSIASVKSKAKKDGKSDEEVKVLCREAMAKRYNAIVTATIGFRHPAEKVSPLEAMIGKVGREALTAMARAKGTKLPTKEKYDALFEAALVRFKDSWTEEAERRLAMVKAADPADELDDFFAAEPETDGNEADDESDESEA